MKEIVLTNVRLSEMSLELVALCAGASCEKPTGVLHVSPALEQDALAIWTSASCRSMMNANGQVIRSELRHFCSLLVDVSLPDNGWKVSFADDAVKGEGINERRTKWTDSSIAWMD